MKTILSQQLKNIFTTKMQESVKVLQMPQHELEQYILDVAEQNPAIDLDALEQSIDVNREMYFKDQCFNGIKKSSKDEDYWYGEWNFSDDKESSLQNYLLEQAAYSGLSDREMRICRYIAYSLDDNGFLNDSCESISERLSEDSKLVSQMIHFMQGLDPCGVCTDGLVSCLLLQLESISEAEVAKEIVRNHLNLLAGKKYQKIAGKLNCNINDVIAASEIISQLDPIPARGFFTSSTQYVYPDVQVTGINGKYSVKLYKETPQIKVSESFLQLYHASQDETIAQYISDSLRHVELLKDCIARRNVTLLRICNELITAQQAFFEKGVNWLHPLSINEIAERLGLHQSTVSRAVNGKYLSCSWGTFKIRSFFCQGIKSGDQSRTPGSIKQQIDQIIRAERPDAPFSDCELAAFLNKIGVEISRRTIAKYRSELGYASAAARRQERAAASF